MFGSLTPAFLDLFTNALVALLTNAGVDSLKMHLLLFLSAFNNPLHRKMHGLCLVPFQVIQPPAEKERHQMIGLQDYHVSVIQPRTQRKSADWITKL